MGLEPIVDRGLRQIQSEYPQAHIANGKHGKHGEGLVTVPTFKLRPGWTSNKEPADICTVLFIRPCGFPAARPEHFFVDIPLRLADLSWPQASRSGDIHGFEQWKDLHWFSWHLQAWDPSRDSLYTYLKVIHMRLNPAR